MRTKALILGALPQIGFESERVSLEEEKSWTVKTACLPVVEKLHGEIELEIEGHTGRTYQVPVTREEIEVSGKSIRASFVREFDQKVTVSIILEAT